MTPEQIYPLLVEAKTLKQNGFVSPSKKTGELSRIQITLGASAQTASERTAFYEEFVAWIQAEDDFPVDTMTLAVYFSSRREFISVRAKVLEYLREKRKNQ